MKHLLFVEGESGNNKFYLIPKDKVRVDEYGVIQIDGGLEQYAGKVLTGEVQQIYEHPITEVKY